MNKFTKIGFILATLGSSIGLGHIWRFTYMVGENGGGAFVLLYLVLSLCIGTSMLLAEMLFGNKARSNPMDSFVVLDKMSQSPVKSQSCQTSQNTTAHFNNTMDKAAKKDMQNTTKTNKNLQWLGLNAITGILILSFYSVVLGWIIYYLGVVSFDLPTTLQEAQEQFAYISEDSIWYQTLCFSIIIALTGGIVALGIKRGIEKLNLVLMPLLFLIFIGLLCYAFCLDEFSQSVAFMFSFEPSKITADIVVVSLGQVFFSLSLGVGTIAVYASSSQENENLLKSALWVVISGIVISLIAGLIILTFIYHFQGEPNQGVGLLLISLPLAFSALNQVGSVLSVLFFIAVIFAGITSSVSMLEPCVSILRDKFAFSQKKASFVLSIVAFALGFLIILWSNTSLNMPKIANRDLFDVFDFITSSLLMPLGMLVLLIFMGYRIDKAHLRLWLSYLPNVIFYIWWVILRYIAPLVIIVILLHKLYKDILELYFNLLYNAFQFITQ